MIRVAFPVMLALSVLAMWLAALVALVVSLSIPVLLFVAGGALVVSLRGIGAGIELIRAGFATLGHAFGFLTEVFTLTFVWPDLEQELTDTPFPKLLTRLRAAQFPEVHQLQLDVAQTLGVTPVEELWVSPGAELGIGTAKQHGVRRRFLVVGFELLHVMSPAQLRAALFHEFGHQLGGDLWLGRWARHLILRLLVAAHAFSWLNPARWAAQLSLFLVDLSYLPWSRAKEYAADRCAARYAGPEALGGALRAVQRETGAVERALDRVLDRVASRRVSPTSLTQAARAVRLSLSATDKHRFASQDEGDPLDLGRRTHPPIALRLAALQGLPTVTSASCPPFDPQRLAAFEAQLNRSWTQGLGPQLEVNEFLSLSDAPARVTVPFVGASWDTDTTEPAGENGTSPNTNPNESDAPLELDHAGEWWRNPRQ
jgi:Zn-dependent protease with chaperone function